MNDGFRLRAAWIGARTKQAGSSAALKQFLQPAVALGAPSPLHLRQVWAPTHHMHVWVTGYDLIGATATGSAAGPGICAVDPAFIPLGTRITIAGIGTCVAQDTGPDVIGAHIDVWVPDVSTAYAVTSWRAAAW